MTHQQLDEIATIEIHRQLHNPGLMMEIISITDRLLHQATGLIIRITIIIIMLHVQQRLPNDLIILTIKYHQILMDEDRQIMTIESIMKILKEIFQSAVKIQTTTKIIR